MPRELASQIRKARYLGAPCVGELLRAVLFILLPTHFFFPRIYQPDTIRQSSLPDFRSPFLGVGHEGQILACQL